RGTITGRVVSDDGQPVGNTTVTLRKRANATMPGGPTVATDTEGKFVAENLDPGFYSAWAYIPGYTTVSEPAYGSDEPRYHRLGEHVVITMTKGGVITGTVRDANGDPVVAVPVRAVFVRDLDGRPPSDQASFFYGQPRHTDDRGIYRIYSLRPGNYTVSVGGVNEMMYGRISPYAGDAPTYHPSATRDGATEVTVQSGQEVSGVDIRHRSERGRTISGKVSGTPPSDATSNSNIFIASNVSITLTHAASGMNEGFTSIQGNSNDRSFSLDSVADGDYEITARLQDRKGIGLASTPQRVTVRGADVTGLNITLAPLASISGRVTLEPLRESDRAGGVSCTNATGHAVLASEALIAVRREEKKAPTMPRRLPFSRADAVPDEQGEFTINGLNAGQYRLNVLLPGEDWYVRDLNASGVAATVAAPLRRSGAPRTAGTTIAPATPANATTTTTTAHVTAASARDMLMLTQGQRINNVTVVLAEGATSLRGSVTAATEGAPPLPARMRVYLVPSEPERASVPLRYASSAVAGEGGFALTNLAPGRYWLLAQAVTTDAEATDAQTRDALRDEATRTTLRREAEAAAQVIDLKPCQHVKDFSMRRP
ncbi:MAG: carboxypeptidase-like regulatory domain-containing protein, partial [Acidobacteriota bacterium]|nr:carboxypeptidase-like regulatory domain-containing protein [Acidobacteriota bacterium]